MNPSIDSLSRNTSGSTPSRRVPAWIIPIAIIVGFALLFLALFRDRLLPAPVVKVAVVLATVSDVSSNAKSSRGNMLFQASGWIEPDPQPVKATSLVNGVVESVMVLEGQTVRKGDPLARLISEDARLSLATAEQNHETLVSSRDSHLAAIAAAAQKLEGTQAITVAAETLRDEAIDRLARYEGLRSGSFPEQEIVSARLRVARENAQLLVAKSSTAEVKAEIERLKLETKVRENEIRAAAIEVDQAKLALSRTVIPSPISGRVLRLFAAPGQKKMLEDNDIESSTIAILYEPSKLQVRVDVPLADAAGLQIGQTAHIRCSLLPEKVFAGAVTRITGEADVQRNTLQAKVRINDPVDQLRPEMLCRVEFEAQGTSSTGIGSVATWIPETAAGDGHAWVCDPETKRITKRDIVRSNESRDGFVRVSEGLRPGEWVILSPSDLKEGQRVNPTLQMP